MPGGWVGGGGGGGNDHGLLFSVANIARIADHIPSGGFALVNVLSNFVATLG